MYPAFYIAYFLTAIAFALGAAFRTPKGQSSKALPYILLTLLLPSVGFGLCKHAVEKATKPKDAESPAYYVLSQMVWVHMVYPVFFGGCVFFLECFYYEYFHWDRVLDVVSVSLFVLLLLGIPVLGTYILITLVLPSLIAQRFKRPLPVRTTVDEQIVNDPKWKRRATAEPDDTPYRINDEFIPLDDADDDDFIIDLK
jgi:hypothetical protein